MLPRHRRIPLTENAELTGVPRTTAPVSEPARRQLLDALAKIFEGPTATGVDWDVTRESKRDAWRAR